MILTNASQHTNANKHIYVKVKSFKLNYCSVLREIDSDRF